MQQVPMSKALNAISEIQKTGGTVIEPITNWKTIVWKSVVSCIKQQNICFTVC